MNGYNPMRWDCEVDGCFNKKCRPKIEEFAECFPGSMAFTDIDMMIEINGRFLFGEWKSFTLETPTGQRIAYERLVNKCPATMIMLYGNAETMEVKMYRVLTSGQKMDWTIGNLEDVKTIMSAWSDYATRRRNGPFTCPQDLEACREASA